jgi:septal ring factor EnvC (AmiA/AmiB activator)
MEEAIKNRVVIILIILSVMLFISTVGSCSNAYRQRTARNREMITRLDLEEKMTKFSSVKKTIDDKLTALEKELEEEKTAHQATKNALVQEQLVDQSIKEELTKVTKLKEALEEDLKEALVSCRSAKPKMK